MLTLSGQVTDLNALCKHNENRELITTVKPKELARQGLKHIRAGFLKSAVADFTQAINAEPNFLEAYIARAYVRERIGDIKGVVEDYQKVVDIYRSRGKLGRADLYLERLRELGLMIQYGSIKP